MKINNPPLLSVKGVLFTRDMTAASGTQAVTGVGFRPRAIIFLAGQDGQARASWGFYDGATSQGLGPGGSASQFVSDGPWCILIATTISVTEQQAAVTSLDADGFTLTWLKTGSPTGTGRIIALCLR